MRLGLSALLFALSSCLVTTSTQAENASPSVMAIDDTLFSHQTQWQEAQKATQAQHIKVHNQQAELDRLIEIAKQLNTQLQSAKAHLEHDYLKMIDEPELDITPSQNAYQAAWAEVKQNQQQRLAAEQTLQEQQAQLTQLQTSQEALAQKIKHFEQDKLRARSERLRTELKRASVQKVSFTNVCSASMTLQQCNQQTLELAQQKAVKQFQAWLINETTESSLVKQHLANISLNIHLLSHKIVESGFYSGNKFKTVIEAQLEARPTTTAPCSLLNIHNQYCFAAGEDQQNTQQQEVAWISLVIRSNQYHDNVSIDGVRYGSTPIEVMLPAGKHLVVIEKEGYRTFRQEIDISSDHTLRAMLHEQANELKAGDKFADTLKNNQQAPEMITLVAGQYLLGENIARQIHLDHAFALSATPVTVEQFKSFTQQTGYQTDAELQNICLAVNETAVAPISGSHWQKPGFSQTAQSPVVCVSQNDANAYTRWLSQQTGFKYRLPTEDEWEVAARAGSKMDYWWGNHFSAGQANTGWAGTPWSNKSTSPVRAFAANPLGFYDMVGNVWQWTNDPRGVVKGGAWSFSPDMAKAYSQLFVAPSAAANYVGFRILREL
ncbi:MULTISPECIES: SUMF1/EgtB/PvdO family nonheme iron enzyme [unclassified Vibrio]|nr:MULTISPECIES: SUMF1/EgtB/PvdO family nonheme iron enzyme [unclassified Vibrio]NAW68303.1 SUMF1/EgtB/PvdO family nonheme iron enzyme [Vibrio sp. V28_P6S34P95]NAX05878.1 SUMF1/EgtB/PvdO family nonheme iron enzyme [Vibrio sp. V30_P3S12P165]NAX38521.1 SUMF1/EgtB/PvdO family nonheme iron enzyme [Vibrio sp. V27_P1S3P104]